MTISALPGDTINYQKRDIVIPEGQFWLEGDNKKLSKDSREYGAVPIGLLEGVVAFRVWPYSWLCLPEEVGFRTQFYQYVSSLLWIND